MAVAFVSDIENTAATATSVTCASVPGGTGDLLIATLIWRRNSAQLSAGATYNGVAMTQIGGDVTGEAAIAMFYMIAPAGTANVVLSVDTVANLVGFATVFSGAHQTTPIGTRQTMNSTGTATSTSDLTSEVGGLCFDAFAKRTDETGLAANGGQTEHSNQSHAGSYYARTSSKAGAATVNMGWAWTNSANFTHFAVPIAPAAGGLLTSIGTRRRFFFLGTRSTGNV